jgi:hypothetical protein
MHNSSSQLISLQYDAATKTYAPWSVRPTATPVYAGETGTIDIDSNGRMWLATESIGIEMYYSDYPYTTFTGPDRHCERRRFGRYRRRHGAPESHDRRLLV